MCAAVEVVLWYYGGFVGVGDGFVFVCFLPSLLLELVRGEGGGERL